MLQEGSAMSVLDIEADEHIACSGEVVSLLKNGLVTRNHRFVRLIWSGARSVLRCWSDDLLKPIKEFLGDEYCYEEIRLVRALSRHSGARP